MLSDMNEIQKFKEFLGPIAEDYNDGQLRQLRREMYTIAGLLLDIHLSVKQGDQSIDSQPSGATLKAERSKNESPLG